MAEKVTIMVLKVVDLQCSCCYKKIKKILCKFPQIRDQVYDEKANTVTITVVCCDPEKIRDKLCCKGHRVIKSIEIKAPKPKEKPVKPKECDQVERPKPNGPPTVEKTKDDSKPDPPIIENPPIQPGPIGFPGPPPPHYPVPTCCSQCYAGHAGGPCQLGYGTPPPPRPYFEGYSGCRCGHGCGYGYGRDCRGFSRCDYYLSEENPSSCSVM